MFVMCSKETIMKTVLTYFKSNTYKYQIFSKLVCEKIENSTKLFGKNFESRNQ